MEKLRDVTLVFLLKRSGGEITEICLAMKKRGFGIGRWNGVGGKVDKEGETIIEAAIRETKEEINVTIEKLKQVAELSFYFPHNPAFNQKVNVYFVEEWLGAPTESEEMNPKWFSINNLPYSEMWPDDIFWLPKALEGNIIKASFEFGEKDIILNKEINIIESFN